MADPEDITAWQRIGPDLTTSGKLAPTDIPRLAAIGTRHVINLSNPGDPGYLENEAELLERAGIAYSDVPVPFTALEEAHYERFASALESGEKPVHVHCIMNWRVSAFLYRYHRERGMSEAEARTLMTVHWEPDRRDDYPAGDLWGGFIAAANTAA